jgi:hypothetical protein
MSRSVVPAVLAATLLAAGCTPTYVAPRTGALAQVSLSRGALEEREQAKLMVSDARWSRRADITGGLMFTYDRPAAVPAGAPIYMELQTLRFNGVTELYCGAHFVFVPESGHRYSVAPDTHGGAACTATVTDLATGQAPASFVVLPVGPDWRPAD